MPATADSQPGRHFEVHVTRRDSLRSTTRVTSCEVRLPEPVVRGPARELAGALLRAVLEQTASKQLELLPFEPVDKWVLRLAQKGPVDEFTLGVQATFLDPSGRVVSLLGLAFPEDAV